MEAMHALLGKVGLLHGNARLFAACHVTRGMRQTLGMAGSGMAWHGIEGHGTARHGSAWHGSDEATMSRHGVQPAMPFTACRHHMHGQGRMAAHTYHNPRTWQGMADLGRTSDDRVILSSARCMGPITVMCDAMLNAVREPFDLKFLWCAFKVEARALLHQRSHGNTAAAAVMPSVN